jgi:hypothetical protein
MSFYPGGLAARTERSGPILRGLVSLAIALSAIRGPLVAGLVSIALFQVPQIVELLLVFAEDKLLLWPQLLFTVVFYGLLCSLLFRISHDLLNITAFTASGDPFRRSLKRLFPILIAALPIVGLLDGVDTAYKAVDGVKAAPLGQAAEERRTSARSLQVEARAQQFKPTPEVIQVSEALTATLKEIKQPQQTLYYTRLVLIVGLAAFVAFAFWHSARGGQNRPPMPAGDTEDPEKIIVPTTLRLKWVWVLAFALLVALFTAQSMPNLFGPGIDLTQIPRLFGSLPIALLFLIFLAVFLSLLTRVYDRAGVPVITLLIITGFVASYLDINNNHAVATVNRKVEQVPPLGLQFAQWLENRPGGVGPDSYVRRFVRANNRYPIYLIAAQGGGQYASMFASSTLTKLFDRCPALGRHLFAISGVSGGSVGSSLFTSFLKAEVDQATARKARDPSRVEDLLSDRCEYNLLDEKPGASKDGRGYLEDKLFAYQDADFLSPLLAQTFFGDMLQRALPFPVPAFDRARAFEAGVASRFRRQTGLTNGTLLESDFLDHWTPQSNSPMLLLNTTRVQTGEPITFAPFLSQRPVINGSEVRTVYGIPFGRSRPATPTDPAETAQSLTLLSAASLSARFPFVAPAGRLTYTVPTLQRGGDIRQKLYFDLVDGGVFESSGVDTLNSFLNQIEFYANYPGMLSRINDTTRDFYRELAGKIEFRVIILNEAPIYNEGPTNLNELTASPLALYRARAQRANMAINTMLSQRSADTRVIRLNHDPFALPLGWQLSQTKLHLITRLIGQPDQCADFNASLNSRVRNWLVSSYVEGLQAAYGYDKASSEEEKARIRRDVSREATRVWNLYSQMYSNRCVLKSIIADLNLVDARPLQPEPAQ